ncbi:DUF4390 domain-containing protein [Rhodoferax sp.]|uniref:DUF4390 domain-containing protein n=1 Tax=Rhodoferax sp. TaxID=50421 RepID=UPI002602060D|nr:DUF4390 domain-containing protein [Rhodoferax sp.]
MMVFSTPCSKKKLPDWVAWLLVALCCWLLPSAGMAQSVSIPSLKLEHNEEGLWLSTALKFELPTVVEDALLKGIPVHFVSEVDVVRERWYWLNKKVSSVQRYQRLSYHPLTRRWRLNVNAGAVTETEQGLTLNQNFDNLQDALNAVQRLSHWRIAEASQLEAGVTYGVQFRFNLDVTQLPRPLQIGTLGQSDWQISLSSTQAFTADVRP